jgi:hypothetical protein
MTTGENLFDDPFDQNRGFSKPIALVFTPSLQAVSFYCVQNTSFFFTLLESSQSLHGPQAILTRIVIPICLYQMLR